MFRLMRSTSASSITFASTWLRRPALRPELLQLLRGVDQILLVLDVVAGEYAVGCPVAVDDAWKSFEEEPVLMRRVKKKNILDFSKWGTKAFEPQFQKLLSGLKIFY